MTFFRTSSVWNILSSFALRYLTWNYKKRFWRLYSHLWLSFCFFRLISDVLDFFVCDLALFSFKHDFLTPAKFAGGADGCFPPWNGTQEQLGFWQFHKVFFVPDVPLLFGIALIHDCCVFGSLSLEETWKPKNRALPLNSHSNQKQRTVNS